MAIPSYVAVAFTQANFPAEVKAFLQSGFSIPEMVHGTAIPEYRRQDDLSFLCLTVWTEIILIPAFLVKIRLNPFKGDSLGRKE